MKIKITHKLISVFVLSAFLSVLFSVPSLATEYRHDDSNSEEVWRVNQDINNKRSEITELRKQISTYKKNIKAKQNALFNLSSQISTINDSIAKINLEIRTSELEIETLNLKIENTELKIDAKEKEIDDRKEVVGEIIRTVHRQNQNSSILEILVMNENFSKFISELEQLENIQDSLIQNVDELQTIKFTLNNDKESLGEKKEEISLLNNILENRKLSLSGQKVAKDSILQITHGQEAKFQQLLNQSREEQRQLNNELVYLEKVGREKLNRQLALEAIESDGMMWPVSSRIITAYFHDVDYPYRHIFEHNAIDIAVPQGTPLRAADSGYIAKVRDGGRTGYSYIMIIHPDGLSTVYGHVNQINVSVDQYVSKGQVIGYSGGLPGTNGSGPFSTGPHLHLEVRYNGIPVNPLNYLP